MTKKTTTQKIKITPINKIINKYNKSEVFKKEYNEELSRLQIARQIKKIRHSQKLNQEELAKKIDMPQSVIARIESGRHSVSLSTLNRIVFGLGKTLYIK